jgi:hypothetical protein
LVRLKYYLCHRTLGYVSRILFWFLNFVLFNFHQYILTVQCGNFIVIFLYMHIKYFCHIIPSITLSDYILQTQLFSKITLGAFFKIPKTRYHPRPIAGKPLSPDPWHQYLLKSLRTLMSRWNWESLFHTLIQSQIKAGKQRNYQQEGREVDEA